MLQLGQHLNQITRNLILGKKTERGEEMDWYVTERYLLKMKAIGDFTHRFFKNKDDPVHFINYGKGTDDDFLKCLDDNNEILESEIVTVSEVLVNFGVDKKRVVEILTGVECNKKVFYNNSYGVVCGEEHKQEHVLQWVYDIQFLNKARASEI